MTPFRFNHVTWYDIVGYLANTASEPGKPSKIYCWEIFKTPDNADKPFNRDAFFDYLLMECGDFEAIFPNVEMVCTRLSAWTSSRIDYWQRIYDVLCADYEPLWNYNRTDEEKSDTTRNRQNDILDKVAGYDSGNLVDSNNENAISNEDENYTHYIHAYGNIGVMSTQDLLKQEIEVANISMYDIILQEFKNTFCLAIYT